MNLRFSDIMSETLGAALGTTIGIAVVGYGLLTLITSSIEVIF